MTEWRTYALGNLGAPQENAFATGPFGSSISRKYFVDEGIPVIRGSNLSTDVGTMLKDEQFVFVDEDMAAKFPRSIVRRGDLLFTCWGTVGQVGYVPDESKYERYIVSNKQMKMTPDSTRVDSLFLYYLLSSPQMLHEFRSQAIGTSVPGFNLGQLKKMTVSLPHLTVQEGISRSLRYLDEMIEKNQQQLAILEQMAQLLYRDWFVRFRFAGDQDIKTIESELGPIPQDWLVHRLGDECQLVMGQSPKSEYYNDVGAGLPFHQGVTDFGRRFPTHRRWTTVDKRVAEKGDILFSVRAPVGRINVAPSRLVVGRGLCAIRSSDGHQNFLLQQLKERFAVEDSMGGGTIFNSVTKKDVESIALLKPSDQLVQEFESVVSPIVSLVENLTRMNIVLSETRDLLLPGLVSGEMDISGRDLALGAMGA